MSPRKDQAKLRASGGHCWDCLKEIPTGTRCKKCTMLQREREKRRNKRTRGKLCAICHRPLPEGRKDLLTCGWCKEENPWK